MQRDDFVESLREQEKILGEKMQSSVHRWMDELLRTACSPETLIHLAAEMGIDLSQNPEFVRQNEDDDSYRVLGLEKTAAEKEVKKRYRELLFILHPDTAVVRGTESMLQQVITAYQKIAKERRW